MSTRNLRGGKAQPMCEAVNLTIICLQSVWNMWEPRRLTAPRTLRPVTASVKLPLRFNTTCLIFHPRYDC
jgi:hypothetical protein